MSNKKKKKWSKPECLRIRLVPEEATLITCKTNVQSGPTRTPCTGGGSPCKGGGFS